MANSNTTELFEALTLLAKEKGIDPAVLIEKIQTALVIAIKKEYPRSENIKFDIDIAKGKFDVAIQKEVADRLSARPCTKDYGAITVAVDAVANVTTTRVLPRTLFYPAPNVDSAVVRIDIDRTKYDIADHALFRRTVKAAFAMRRKTLVNNLMVGFSLSRADAENVLARADLAVGCRGEELSTEQFVALYKVLAKVTQK